MSFNHCVVCFQLCRMHLKVMLHETICNVVFWLNKALQHCCDIVSNSYIVPTLQRCVTLKSSLPFLPCNIISSL